MADSTPRAIVVGAGPGGLATAVALRLVGIDVRVYERDPGAAVGAGLAVAPNAMRALRRIGLADRLEGDAGPPPLAVEIRNQAGRVLSRVELPDIASQLGETSLVVSRRLLQDVLMSALPPGVVEAGRECTAVTQDPGSARVTFADGASAAADLVIGADGLRSVVRGAIGTGSIRYTGSTSWRTLVPATKVPNLAPGTGFEAWGRRGVRFGMGHLGPQIYCYATAPAPAGTAAPDGERVLLQKLVRDWAAPVPELVAAFSEPDLIRTDINRLVDVDHWASGRLVVIGDAAHAMTPDLGQGACQALEDAVFLAAALAEVPDIPGALRHFETTRRGRPERIARQARSISRLVQSTSPVVGFARDLITRLSPKRSLARRYLKLADVDLPALS